MSTKITIKLTSGKSVELTLDELQELKTEIVRLGETERSSCKSPYVWPSVFPISDKFPWDPPLKPWCGDISSTYTIEKL